MFKAESDRKENIIEHFNGGNGSFRMLHIAEQSEMSKLTKLFAVGTLEEGASVGRHTHNGTMEICCFLSGKGLVAEKNATYEVSSGDVTICKDGEEHEIINTGSEPLSYVLLVLYTRTTA